MADRDILFAVKNHFYLGAYNLAINEASDLEGLSEAEQTEKDTYVYRSYIALGSYDVRCVRRGGRGGRGTPSAAAHTTSRSHSASLSPSDSLHTHNNKRSS